MGRVQDKVVIVTGAAQGLGEAMARMLAREGAIVVATDINEAGVKAVAADIVKNGGRAEGLLHDVISEEGWQKIFDHTLGRYKRLDVLINNAGGGTYADLETVSLQEWRRVLSLNLDSTFIGTQMAIAAMKTTGGGSIINLSSVGGLVGTATLAPYSAAKAGIKLFTKCAAIHCGQKGYNIRVNTVHPGLIKTPAGIEMASKATGMSAEAAEAAFATLHPIGRIGRPDEIASAVLFLASDESSFATGGEFVIDGGYTAQ